MDKRGGMMEKIKICCLTYKKLQNLVQEALEDIADDELEVITIEGLREELVPKVDSAIANGFEVAIGGDANAKVTRNYCDIPVINYQITSFDYLEAIDKAFSMGDKVAMVSYRTPLSKELLAYFKRVGVDITNIIYESNADLEKKVVENGCDVLIGAALSQEIATKLNRKSVSIYPGKESIIASIYEAKELARQIRRTNERAKFLKSVVTYSTNGLILVDEGGVVVEFNKSAGDMFGKSTSKIKGHLAMEAIPECSLDTLLKSSDNKITQIIKIKDKEFMQTFIRLTGNAELPMGSLFILTSISEFKKAQLDKAQHVRKITQEKGFKAKHRFGDIIGNSPNIKMCVEEAKIFSQSSSSVLIYGETGVGKEIFAQSIHSESDRKDDPFIAINCAALPDNLLETELFGYDEGAFTGGRKGGKKGLFELADGGTIFLDEIGELSPLLQTRLLRVLQEREIMHVGGDRVIPVDVRIISATNKDLENMPNEKFRKDLLYRLNVLEVKIPPLRVRGGDVALLFEHFYLERRQIEDYGMELPKVCKEIISLYTWQGNIRELQNVCERFCLYLTKSGDKSEKFIKRCIVKAIGEEKLFCDITKNRNEGNIDAKLVEMLGEVFSYTKEQIAEKMGVSRTTLWRILKAK